MQFKSLLLMSAILGLVLVGCSSEKQKNEAKEAAAHYWQDKAYPGKAYDVQVIDAEKDDNGKYRVKGIVDGETRVGEFDPNSETFSEGYYSSAHEKTKRIAELEEEVKYWKDRSENQEKEIYKLKVRLNLATGKKIDDSENAESESADEHVDQKPAQSAPSAKAMVTPSTAAAPPTAPAPPAGDAPKN